MGRRKRRKSLGNRVWFIDEVRGMAIILMVVYHLCFDLVYIFNVKIEIFDSAIINFMRDVFAGLFIFISGISCRFSSSNLKRGIICFLFGIGVTLVTFFFMRQETIYFGALHMLGISMILYNCFEKLLNKIKFPIFGIVIAGLLFYFTKEISRGKIAIWTFYIDDSLRKWLFPFGIVSSDFHSWDYFPLVPWVFVFLAGCYFGVYVIENRLPEFFYNMHSRPIAFVGRHTLWIYLFHQPILYGLLYVIFNYVCPYVLSGRVFVF